jgi:hypothetical protein
VGGIVPQKVERTMSKNQCIKSIAEELRRVVSHGAAITESEQPDDFFAAIDNRDANAIRALFLRVARLADELEFQALERGTRGPE